LRLALSVVGKVKGRMAATLEADIQ
jgi:hypothetical protein